MDESEIRAQEAHDARQAEKKTLAEYHKCAENLRYATLRLLESPNNLTLRAPGAHPYNDPGEVMGKQVTMDDWRGLRRALDDFQRAFPGDD